MFDELALILFDIDGTVVDGQGHIIAATHQAFDAFKMPRPEERMIREGVGLSVSESMRRLAPSLRDDQIEELGQRYKDEYVALRRAAHPESDSPLYPEAYETLHAMAQRDTWVLGTATGKSMRGLQHMIEQNDLTGVFTTLQCADNNPSKPNPMMVKRGMSTIGVPPARCIMVGDTTFDMQAGKLAGAKCIGVSWGYHDTKALQNAGADAMAGSFSDIPRLVERLLGER